MVTHKVQKPKNIVQRCPEPGCFAYIESQIRAAARATVFGHDFEKLCKWFLLNAPKYKPLLSEVWLWEEWPGRWGADCGIDLVVQAADGMLWAVQCKADNPSRSIPKRELDSFLAESNRSLFSYRLIIATTNDISQNARRTIRGQTIPVGLELRGDLLEAEVRWPTRIGTTPRPLAKRIPRPHQRRAIDDIVNGFQHHDRVKLIMACGTGKTLTARWIVERLHAQRTLVLVPSLSLVSQTLCEWSRTAAQPFECQVVCSDESVADARTDHAVMSTAELGVPVTTDLGVICRFLERRSQLTSVTLCTYQSSELIARAQRNGSIPPFDLVIADEAHRCTGHVGSLFTTVLDPSKIRAKKRLFMTATPRYFTDRVCKHAANMDYELASMDDEQAFGPVFHELTFDEAIHSSPPLLTDYQVVVIGVTNSELKKWADEGRLVRTESGVTTDARTLAGQIGLAKAIGKHNLRKIITFQCADCGCLLLTTCGGW